jgi:hypothetical protein
MITWSEFERQQPGLAGLGRRQFYQFGIGLGFLATVRPGGGPRVHPAIERCRLVLTQADGPFPAGPTIWKAGNTPPSGKVT